MPSDRNVWKGSGAEGCAGMHVSAHGRVGWHVIGRRGEVYFLPGRSSR